MCDCIETTYSRCRLGSGRKYSDGTVRQHHRLVYFQHHGLDLEDEGLRKMDVDHTCGNRACINLAHLDLVSWSENSRRRWGK